MPARDARAGSARSVMRYALPLRMPRRFRDRKIMNGMPPNLSEHYLYLWELTAVRQAAETAWISASVRRTFIEVLVPAGSSSSPELIHRGNHGLFAGCDGDDHVTGRIKY